MTRPWALKSLVLTGAAVSAVAALGVVAVSAKADSEAQSVAASQPAPVSAPATGGLSVYIDEQGNRIAPPPGAKAPTAPWVATKAAPQEKTALKGGGWKMDVSHIRAYNYATVDASGKVNKNCQTRQDAVKP
jgi:hypothetical protein